MKNIFEIKEIRLEILKYLIEPLCISCKLIKPIKDKKYCVWCGYNIYFNIKD